MAKFLVPLTIFLSASLGDAFVNHARMNHLIRFDASMSNPTNEPSCEPICEPTKRMDLDAVLPNNLSQINNAVLSNHSNQQESLADQPGIDEEINYPIAASDSSQPTPINLDFSRLYYATTMTNQEAHLHLASPQSFSSACEPFFTICSFQYGLSSSMV